MEDRCHFCSRELETTYYWVLRGHPASDFVSRAIWVDTTKGRIAVCNICFEHENFGDLSPSDVGAIYYMFGSPFSDDDDTDYTRSIELLTKAATLLPVPEVQSALGYAYWKAGDKETARRLCREALLQQPLHFGHEKAKRVIGSGSD